MNAAKQHKVPFSSWFAKKAKLTPKAQAAKDENIRKARERELAFLQAGKEQTV